MLANLSATAEGVCCLQRAACREKTAVGGVEMVKGS